MIRAPPKLTKSSKKQKTAPKKKVGQVVKSSKMPTHCYFGLQAFPPFLHNTLRYCGKTQVTLSVGTGNYKFRANSLYDPDFTSTGHQPLYFDQLSALYDHYIVVRSRLKIYFASATNANLVVSLYVDDDSTHQVSTDRGAEMRKGKVITGNPSTGPLEPISASWSALQTFGSPIPNDNLQGTSTTNPTEESYYALYFEDMLAGSGTIYFFYEMEFDCVWEELTTITGS